MNEEWGKRMIKRRNVRMRKWREAYHAEDEISTTTTTMKGERVNERNREQRKQKLKNLAAQCGELLVTGDTKNGLLK